MTDGVIFDLDGTLWDATEVTAETWVEVLKNHPEVKPKLPLDIHTIKKYMGLKSLREYFSRTCRMKKRLP